MIQLKLPGMSTYDTLPIDCFPLAGTIVIDGLPFFNKVKTARVYAFLLVILHHNPIVFLNRYLQCTRAYNPLHTNYVVLYLSLIKI